MILLLACATEPESSATEPSDALSAAELLARASLDLRGVRPSVAEIEAVEADPTAVDTMVASFVEDARFGERLRSMYADIYQTRQDAFSVGAADYGLDDEAAFAAAVGDEPLRLLSTIAEEDLPYTQIVTADWSMADETLAAAWPVAYPADATGWQKVSYTDGRPHAGVLTTNGMWWRYQSNASNANRGRANAISRILLCSDYLSRSVSFERNVNLLDQDAVNDALQNNEGCVACHNTLDPLASYLWGFYFVDYTSRSDTSSYHPEREQLWQTLTGVSPAYYGTPGWSIEDLGRQIAADPQLAQCAVEQAFSLMVGREAELEDTARLTELREVFLGAGMTLRPLYAAVAAGPEYRAAGEAGVAKMMSAELYTSAIEDLTGYRFTYQDYDMMRTDTYGLRILAGGVDGVYSTRPATEPTATMLLVHERLAQAAASHVLREDWLDPAAARLFTEVGPTTTPTSDRAAMVAQIQALHLRLYGRRVAADSEEVSANLALWESLHEAEGDVAAAWAGLLSVLLRDPDFLLY